MNKVRLLLALVVLAMLALPAAALAQSTGTVTGTAVIAQRVALPNNTVLTVQLADASRAGAPAQVIAEQRRTTNGAQSPFPFTLTYDTARIAANGIYIVQGNVTVNGQLRYTTTQQYRVITGGNPTSVTITLVAVTLPHSSGENWMLTVAVLLLALALGVHLLRSRLNVPTVPVVARR